MNPGNRKACLIAASFSCVTLFGCASGGGGSSQQETDGLVCLIAGPLCPFALSERQGGAAPQPHSSTANAFRSWAELPRDRLTDASGITTRAFFHRGDDAFARDVEGPWNGEGLATFQYDATGKPVYFQSLTNGFGINGSRYAGIDTSDGSDSYMPGTSSAVGAVLANPYVLGWNYQSFGLWNERIWGASGALNAISFGSATPAHAVPSSGEARFAGKLGAFYIAPTGQGSVAAADLTVDADFSKRSLNFASSGTVAGPDLKAPTAAPHLNLSGTLTYAPGSNTFNGTLRNAGGTMSGSSNGQFYGPAAQELGGAFSLKSVSGVETFTGAYGAKR